MRASAQTWVCVFGWGETEDNSILLIETRVLILSVHIIDELTCTIVESVIISTGYART